MNLLLRIIAGIFRFIGSFLLLIVLVVIMMAGMTVAGYYLLDYLVRGEEVIVPTLVGMKREQAILKLHEYDLYMNPDVEEIPSVEYEPGIVIDQRPFPGDVVKKKRTITVTVSIGAKELIIPDVLMQPEKDAETAILSAGLEVDLKASVYHPKIPSGIVIAQNPLPGRHVVYGNKVDFLISMGPHPVGFVMANYRGMQLNESIAILNMNTSSEIEPDIVYANSPDSSLWNRVVEQRPLPGTRISQDEKIVLTVASSDRQRSQARQVHVVISLDEPVLDPDRLVLQVQDDLARSMNKPVEVPVRLNVFTNEIDQWVTVFGDAFVMLVEREPFDSPDSGGIDLSLRRILNSRHYPLKSVQQP